jgi:hypothetical protein
MEAKINNIPHTKNPRKIENVLRTANQIQIRKINTHHSPLGQNDKKKKEAFNKAEKNNN